MTPKSDNKRIAKNTMILYFRMMFLMLINLYTSRVILDALGVEDYGIYNVVGGFVAMFSILSSALTASGTRYINIAMGQGNMEYLCKVFGTSVSIQNILAIIVFIVSEIVGIWYVNNIMLLPSERLFAANWCLQFSILNFCTSLITVPYNAVIVAHERMNIFAYVSIFEGIAKLIVSFLVYNNPFDRLIYYAFLLLILQCIIRFIYQLYSKKHFQECQLRNKIDCNLLREMFYFSIWQFLGNAATILRTQGLNILLNFFFGPIVNAAKGVANQALSAVTGFVSNFMMALNPQITQSYAADNYSYTLKLVTWGSKLSFFLLYTISLPLILNIEYVLGIWLKEVPRYSAIFVQLSLILSMIESIMKPLITLQNATGKVKKYMIVVSSISLLNLPISSILLYLGSSPVVVYYVAIFLAICVNIARLVMLNRNFIEFSPLEYVKKVILPCTFVTILSAIPPLYIGRFIDSELMSFVVITVISVISTLIFTIFVGCNREERGLIKIMCKKMLVKIRK